MVVYTTPRVQVCTTYPQHVWHEPVVCSVFLHRATCMQDKGKTGKAAAFVSQSNQVNGVMRIPIVVPMTYLCILVTCVLHWSCGHPAMHAALLLAYACMHLHRLQLESGVQCASRLWVLCRVCPRCWLTRTATTSASGVGQRGMHKAETPSGFQNHTQGVGIEGVGAGVSF